MCGIYGVVNFDGSPVRPEMLSTMARRMIHRGPDGEGSWIDGSVGIGMRRLSIIDVLGSQQPIVNETGDIRIVLNGEIFNYRELRRELVEKGHRFTTQGDVEVVLHLYEEMGTDCIQRLNGMFALAIYDGRKQRLWLARDRMGIKPLYYRRLPNGIAFASDLRALAAATGGEVDPSALVSYLGYSYVPEPDTIYRDILKLQKASQLLVDGTRIQMSRYWSADISQLPSWTISSALERLEELMLDAVDLQLCSDVPVGVFLSGGVDSSALAAFAAKASSAETIKTFTIDFIGKKGNDPFYAASLAKDIGTEHYQLKVDLEQQVSALEDLLPMLDEPMADSAIVPTYILARRARENGVKVLLSGAGGDELFGGYSRHFPGRIGSAAWIAQHPWVSRPFRGLMSYMRPDLARRFTSPARNFAIMISGANLEFLAQAFRDPKALAGLSERYECDMIAARSCSPVDRMRLDIENYLPNNVLALTDKATMAASVEGRVPLLDHRVVEFVYSLPPELNPLGGGQKGLFKTMLESYLPDTILKRHKEGFNAPVNIWIERYPEVVSAELLSQPAPELGDLIDYGVVKRWMQVDHLRRAAGESLYALFLLSRWLKCHS